MGLGWLCTAPNCKAKIISYRAYSLLIECLVKAVNARFKVAFFEVADMVSELL